MSSSPGAPVRGRFDVEAPAKVNFGLRVVGVRDDGYHLLESLFAPIDLHDDVTVVIGSGSGREGPSEEADEETDEPRVELALHSGGAGSDADDPPGDVPADERNLAVKAALRFLDRANLRAHVSIGLKKRIPASAGLGGGSSDAAAVLRCLAAAWPGRLSAAALEELALSLGADVPFFLDPVPSLVTGVGERRSPLGDFPSLALLLANPRRSVSTAKVFAGWDQKATPTPQGGLARALEPLRTANWTDGAGEAEWAALLQNDLTDAAEALCPEMAELHEQLRGVGALVTAQSGSGATVYGVFADRNTAERAREALSANDSAWFRVAISLGAR